MKPQRAPIVASLASLLLTVNAAGAAPAIRTSDANRVPACASPERLTSYLHDRNPDLNPRFRDIAHWYRYWGEAWRVRWDYAFFQMIVETNALKFRRADGRYGDVREKQNNFAGIGATGGGVPGDRFPDVKTGVHAQIQHLVAYSGEQLARPVASRTALKQGDIVETSRRLGRPVTFGDLARRWAADRHYARTIEAVAEDFREHYCGPRTADATPQEMFLVPKPQPADRLGAPTPPQKLTGPEPETLPWSKSKVEHGNELSPDPPPRPANNASPGPVRTIWSRDEKPPKRPERPASARVAIPPSPEDSESNARVLEMETAAADGDFPPLPHFRIAPARTEPSRLGGPVPTEPLAPAKTSADRPSARFGEIIAAPSRPAIPKDCHVLTASYGGQKTLLLRAKLEGETIYTALTVLGGFEKSMFDTYTKASAPGAELVGEYPNPTAALAEAHANCARK